MNLWHPTLNRWVAIVTKRGAPLDPSVLQLDATAIERMEFWISKGFSSDDALKRVLGI